MSLMLSCFPFLWILVRGSVMFTVTLLLSTGFTMNSTALMLPEERINQQWIIRLPVRLIQMGQGCLIQKAEGCEWVVAYQSSLHVLSFIICVFTIDDSILFGQTSSTSADYKGNLLLIHRWICVNNLFTLNTILGLRLSSFTFDTWETICYWYF